jgi:predicted aldo/keto reductase-like oxidoreductase
MDRRSFLKTSAVTGASAGLLPLHQAVANPPRAEIQSYPTLGRTGLKISDISFGSGRLNAGEEALVLNAFDRGINYFDTAEMYSETVAETVIGNALKGKRDEIVLASKVVAGANASKESIMNVLNGSLKRLRTDYIDIYFNHAVNNVGRMKNPEWGEFVERAKEQGKIGYAGMSGHAGRLIECLDYSIEHDIVDVILVGYNFGQDPAFYEKFTAGFDIVAKQPDLPRVLADAKRKDIGVIAMKTLMGARLNDMRPYERGGATYAQAAFRWVLSDPNVDALIISMTTHANIEEYLGASGATEVAAGDFALLGRYAHRNGASYCRHACNDCEGACPYGVPIADVMRTRMYATDYEDLPFAKREYAMLGAAASACVSCDGQPCQDACSHGLEVNQLCAPTHELLA